MNSDINTAKMANAELRLINEENATTKEPSANVDTWDGWGEYPK